MQLRAEGAHWLRWSLGKKEELIGTVTYSTFFIHNLPFPLEPPSLLADCKRVEQQRRRRRQLFAQAKPCCPNVFGCQEKSGLLWCLSLCCSSWGRCRHCWCRRWHPTARRWADESTLRQQQTTATDCAAQYSRICWISLHWHWRWKHYRKHYCNHHHLLCAAKITHWVENTNTSH